MISAEVAVVSGRVRGVLPDMRPIVPLRVQPVGDSCRLTVTHDQLREGANQ